jgi:hypothetical protein
MSRHAFFAMAAAALLFVADVRANDPIRIDASSDAAAAASFARMVESLPASRRKELQIAILVLNMDGVSSAYEAIRNPALQRPSIERIKDRVAGMTADEIIELSKGVTSIRVETRSP